MLENIKEKARPFEMRITPILTELLRDHQMIVRALRLRDPLLAEVAFREHNQRVLKRLNAKDLDGRVRDTGIPPKGRKP
jgi:DNA-binding FadR family transcriptional regulator